MVCHCNKESKIGIGIKTKQLMSLIDVCNKVVKLKGNPSWTSVIKTDLCSVQSQLCYVFLMINATIETFKIKILVKRFSWPSLIFPVPMLH